MNRLKNIGMLSVLLLGMYFIFSSNLSANCIIKENFNICCPACGMTRAFRQISEFNIIGAFKYNILAVPIVIAIIYGIIAIIMDIATDKTKFLRNLNDFLGKNYWLILSILAISMIINNIRLR